MFCPATQGTFVDCILWKSKLLPFPIRLFEDEPEMRKYFEHDDPNLAPRDVFETNPLLKMHASTVMGVIDSLILNFHNYDMWTEKADRIGRRHKSIPGYSSEFFWVRQFDIFS